MEGIQADKYLNMELHYTRNRHTKVSVRLFWVFFLTNAVNFIAIADAEMTLKGVSIPGLVSKRTGSGYLSHPRPVSKRPVRLMSMLQYILCDHVLQFFLYSGG